MVESLIHTKLHLPFTRPELVSRPRLQEKIVRGLRGPLTVVTAPAGFGKTTLMASSVEACDMPIAWLSLDKEDNHTGQFLRYLIGTLQHTDERIGHDAEQLLASLQQASHEAVLTSLINDLSNIDTDIALILDDYHLIQNPTAHEDIGFLLDHQPGNFHLAITTRSDPPLPLARLRARGQVVEVRTADLRFTKVEAAQFLKEVMDLTLDEDDIDALEARTEGWIAGLQMAALSMRDRTDIPGFIDSFSGTNRYILDYLLEEVLANQPPEIQRFLLQSSILERLSAPLCDTILFSTKESGTGEPEYQTGVDPVTLDKSTSILKVLDRENLFLVSLDDDGIWFRYHHLFADLLQARLLQSDPELIPQLHTRASTWFEQNGLIPEAIHHLMLGHQMDRAAELIELYGPSHWAESDLSVILMADSLPRQTLIERPKIGLYQSWRLINQGNIEIAYPLLVDMLKALTTSAQKPELHWILTVTQIALAFLTPPGASDLSILPESSVLDEVPSGEPVMRDAADILYGMALGRRGEQDHAIRFSLNSIERMKRRQYTTSTSKEVEEVPSLVPFLATMYLFQGQLHNAAALAQKYLEPIRQKGILVSTAGNLDVVLGEVFYEWNRLEEAEKHIRAGLQANEPWGNIMTDAFGRLALTLVLMAKKDFSGAIQLVDLMEKRLQGLSRPSEFEEPVRTMRARVQLASGDLNAASTWADQVLRSEEYQTHKEHYRLTLARIRLAQGLYTEVEEILTGIPDPSFQGNRITRQIETNMLLAAALMGQQQMQEAMILIASSLALAEPEGYIRVFVDLGESVRDSLAAYLRSPLPERSEFGHQVWIAFSQNGRQESPGNQRQALVEPLSSREEEVLSLMAQGKTNQEIAEQLFVARGTIKAHAANIFRKLDAANRTEAVMRARHLKVIP